MRMSRLWLGRALPRTVAAAILIAPLTLTAQTPQAPAPETAKPAQPALPSARSIIDRHVKEIGGRAAVLSHTSTRAIGTLTVPSAGMSGTIELFAAKPDKSVLKLSIAGVGEILEGFDGKTGWNVSPMTGPMLLEGKLLEE